MNPIQVQALRGTIWQNGFRPVAVKTGSKIPSGKAWPQGARQNPPDASTAWPSPDALNIGILCDGLAALDIDLDDPGIALQIAGLAARYLGNAPSRTRADSPRRLYLYRAAEGEPSKVTLKGKRGKIEILGRGNQFVAYGVHPDGAAYKWPNGGPDSFHRDKLTPVTQDALHAFLCAIAPLIEAETPNRASVPAQATSSLPMVAGSRPAITEREKTYAEKALEEEAGKLSAMRPGDGRNAALNDAAHSLGTMVAAGWLDADTVTAALLEASSANGHTAKHGQAQTQATIQSGLQAGMLKPRDPLPVMQVEPWFRNMVNGWIEAFKTKQAIQASAKRPVTLLPFSHVPPKVIEWLWKGYLPKGKLVLLAAIGGVGKSTISCNWASTVSTGGYWPDGTRCETPGNVIIWSSEDDPSDTIAPRLIAAGADLTRCHFIQGPRDEKGIGRSFDPAADMDELRSAVSQLGGVSLFIVDPLINAVTGDMNKANDVRRSLQSIVDFASETNCAVLGISHFGKNTQGKQSAERILGSAAFKDYSRTALVAVQDEDSGDCALARAKSNLAANMGGFAYRIEPETIGNGIETIRIAWGEELKGSARSILGQFEGEHKEDGEKLSAAKQFLIEILSNGPVQAKEVIRYAREGYDIKEDTLRRAYSEIGAKFTRAGFGGPSLWSLPIANPQQAIHSR